MKIIVGTDHRGRFMADHVISMLESGGHEVEYVASEEQIRCDYPEQAYIVGKAVSEGCADLGILLSGSGIGTTITANKFAGVRAVVGHDEWTAQVSRSHHDSNVLCIPTDMIGMAFVDIVLERWLTTEFSGGRHTRRLCKIGEVEVGRDPSLLDVDACT